MPERGIKQLTREQRNSPMWFDVCCHQRTASMFSEVMRQKTGTPPDSLILQILEYKHFTSFGMGNKE